MRPPEHPVILLDDECVLCHWLVRFIFRYDKRHIPVYRIEK